MSSRGDASTPVVLASSRGNASTPVVLASSRGDVSTSVAVTSNDSPGAVEQVGAQSSIASRGNSDPCVIFGSKGEGSAQTLAAFDSGGGICISGRYFGHSSALGSGGGGDTQIPSVESVGHIRQSTVLDSGGTCSTQCQSEAKDGGIRSCLNTFSGNASSSLNIICNGDFLCLELPKTRC